MSRFCPKVAVPPLYGPGIKQNPTTGLYELDTITPQPLSSAILGTDAVLISRNIGTVALPNWQPFYATPAQVQALAGSGSSGTVINFTGPAGAPTGTQVLTALGSNSTAGIVLDGAGNLVLPAAAYTGGLFTAVPMTGDGDLTITHDGASTAELYISLRSNTANTNGYSLLVNGTGASSSSGSMFLAKVANGNGSTLASNPIAITAVKAIHINCVAGTFKVYLDGVLTWTVTDPSNVIASGYYGVLTAGAAVSTKISQVSFQ